MKKKKFNPSGIYRWIIAISREYIMALSVYLCDLFILHMGNDLNYVNAIFWAILITICFDRMLMYEDNETSKNKMIYRIMRCLFVIINFIAFGINIFA